MIKGLDNSWRPDRSGVLIKIDPAEDGKVAVRLLLIDGPRPLSKKQFASFVANYIDRGIEVFLQKPGPIGFYPAQCSLNNGLKPHVDAKNLAAVQRELKAAYNALAQYRFGPDGLVMRSSLQTG